MNHPELILFFFTIALLYASVGFGGGSSYLALLSLYGVDYEVLRLTALCCNIVVVSGGVYIFWKEGFLKWKKVLPLVFLSIPLAYLGGNIQLEEQTFFILLGITLCISGILVFLLKKEKRHDQQKQNFNTQFLNSSLGGGIGFLSGLVGIGGGIFLAPLLHLMRWDASKIIAATASFFIFVNSIAGIAGQTSKGIPSLNWTFIGLLIGAVFFGGQIGARLGAIQFSPILVRRMTAILVLLVGLRILYKHLII